MSRVPASPHFFRPVKGAFYAGVVALVMLAIVFPAPLEVAADPSSPPNPAKSAWFLLWIQELVSHETMAIYVALAMALLLVALPWLATGVVDHATWFRREHARVWAAVLAIAFAIVALTVVGLFFRGADWCFVAPF